MSTDSYLGDDLHFCDLCRSTFRTLRELRDHDCAGRVDVDDRRDRYDEIDDYRERRAHLANLASGYEDGGSR